MNDLKNVDDYCWLSSEAGCAAVAGAVADARPLHTLASELRKEMSPERAHLVLEQRELRNRAKKKFDRASEMLFTKRGLEQATDQWIAIYKASRFPEGTTIADLCCGIGGDLLALATRGQVIGVEREPCVAQLAQANLRNAVRSTGRLVGDPSDTDRPNVYDSRIVLASAEEFDVASVNAWHCDPDRRPKGRRTTRTEYHAPNEESITQLLENNPNSAVKLAPASDAPSIWTEEHEVEWEWISRGRECRQLVAWGGKLARNPNRHVATVVSTDGRQPRSFAGLASESAGICDTVNRYVYVPNPALFAARLDGAIANEHGLVRIGKPGTRPGGYLTGGHPIDDLLLDCFEVTEVLPLDAKRIASLLRACKIGTVEIKHRGIELEPNRFRKRLGLQGDRAATLLATAVGDKAVAILAQRSHSR